LRLFYLVFGKFFTVDFFIFSGIDSFQVVIDVCAFAVIIAKPMPNLRFIQKGVFLIRKLKKIVSLGVIAIRDVYISGVDFLKRARIKKDRADDLEGLFDAANFLDPILDVRKDVGSDRKYTFFWGWSKLNHRYLTF